ncbi:MAG: hypothetical protein AAF798_05430 [Bacteroidota bacterium]
MLSIFAPTKYHTLIAGIIQQEDRLEELVRIVDYLEERPIPSATSIVIKEDAIWPVVDWYNVQPPYLLPENIELNASNLLGLIFAYLENYEKAHAHLYQNNPGLYLEIDNVNRLKQGVAIDPEQLASHYTPFEEYRLMHNQAVVRHYAAFAKHFDANKAKYFYLEAFQCAPNEEYQAFTANQFAQLLTDTEEVADAERLLQAMLHKSISAEAATALKQTLCQAWMAQLVVPYDQELLELLKANLWDILQAYEQQERLRDQALVLIDAGIIANYSESWSESLGYFNKALAIFEAEGLPEMAAHVHYRKGTLLFTWAQKGNPQFYRPAAQSYQAAVRVFTQLAAPEVYAEIQHHLGMIYAEIPDEIKKKSIWAAVSSAAFQEALQFYTKEQYPYEYAAVCNHYGNALSKYPAAKLSDNLEKALYYYQEALAVRTAAALPLERSLTLLNYLEAQWYLGMPEDRFEEDRYQDMLTKAREVLAISPDTNLKKEAERHLEELDKLRAVYA